MGPGVTVPLHWEYKDSFSLQRSVFVSWIYLSAGLWHLLDGMMCWSRWWCSHHTVTRRTTASQMGTVVPPCWQSHISPVLSSLVTWLWSTCISPSSWRTSTRHTKKRRLALLRMTLRCSTSDGQSKHSGSRQLTDKSSEYRSELRSVWVLPAQFVPVVRPQKDVLWMFVIMAHKTSLFLPTVICSIPIWYKSTSPKRLSQGHNKFCYENQTKEKTWKPLYM